MGKGPSAPGSTLNSQSSLANSFGNAGSSLLGGAASNLNTAGNFYQQLLSGGQGAQNVVAPSAMNISQVYGGNQKTLQDFMPAGGERNLALQQNQLGKTSSIANLYANVQPMAAQGLASLGATAGGLGTSAGGVGMQGLSSLTNYQAQQNAAKGSALGSLGTGLGTFTGLGLSKGGFLRK